ARGSRRPRRRGGGAGDGEGPAARPRRDHRGAAPAPRLPRGHPEPRRDAQPYYNRLVKPGDLLDGRFELERAAASGGMGVVYRALDRETGGLAAVKAVRVTGADSEARFAREAELLATLRHPGIVAHLAHGRIDDELYLAMEWLEGEDLATRL